MFSEIDRNPIGSQWKITKWANVLNALCGHKSSSYIDQLLELFPVDYLPVLIESYTFAFQKLRSQCRNIVYFVAPSALTREEHAVYMAIIRKTLDFGKIAEKIPRRLFLQGQLSVEGSYLIDDYGVPVLPPVISDDRNLSRAIKGLRKKGYIGQGTSEPHPMFGQSSVYTPLPARYMLSRLYTDAEMYRGISNKVDNEDAEQFDAVHDKFITWIESECSELVANVGKNDEASPFSGLEYEALLRPTKKPKVGSIHYIKSINSWDPLLKRNPQGST